MRLLPVEPRAHARWTTTCSKKHCRLNTALGETYNSGTVQQGVCRTIWQHSGAKRRAGRIEWLQVRNQCGVSWRQSTTTHRASVKYVRRVVERECVANARESIATQCDTTGRLVVVQRTASTSMCHSKGESVSCRSIRAEFGVWRL